MRTPPYPSDLTDEQWELLEPLLPGRALTGRKPKYELREIVNAIFYLLVQPLDPVGEVGIRQPKLVLAMETVGSSRVAPLLANQRSARH